MWLFVMVRDIFAAVIIGLVGSFLGIFSIPAGTSIAVLVVLPLVSAVGCVVAMYADFSHKHHWLGTVGGGAAIAGAAFPGLFFGFGVVGMVLGVIALALHMGARKEFAVPAP